MGYDLYLKPAEPVDRRRFFAYFRGRPWYEVDRTQAWYRNEDTGVYFVFEPTVRSERATAPFLFSVNFNRPTFFGLEAEPELTAVVREFGMSVVDQQEDMRDGTYRSGRFVAAWRRGNAAAVAMHSAEPGGRPDTLPAARLLHAWRWNLARREVQAARGEEIFVPRILLARRAGRIRTFIVWTDAIPCLFPSVDDVVVLRKDLALDLRPGQENQLALSPLAEILERLKGHLAARRDFHELAYDPRGPTPPAVVDLVRGLPETSGKLGLVAPDEVVDEELVPATRR